MGQLGLPLILSRTKSTRKRVASLGEFKALFVRNNVVAIANIEAYRVMGLEPCLV
jgi:hypothetical protein